jgi:hypothetical protein
MNVHDLPAAIRPRSRSFSSDVHRILGTTQSFLRRFAPSSGRHLDLLAGSQSSICTSVRQTFWFSESRPELVAREVKVSGQDQQHTRRSLSVTGQLPPFPMRVYAMEFENSLDLSVKRSIYAHFSEQHRSPIFGGIDQHLNSQSPFPRIAL